MITEKTLNNIYSKNINGETITTQDLVSYGLNYNDINKLLEKGILQRIDRGLYGLNSIESLYNYGIYLINIEAYDKAYNIFTKCHNINPNHLETCEYLFFLSIKKDLNKESYEWLEKINTLNDAEQTNIYNVYLYLLTYFIGSVPKTKSNILKNMQLKELLLSNQGTPEEYEISEYDLNDVLKVIGNTEENTVLSPLQKLILNELIKACKNKEDKLQIQLLKLASQRNYNKIVSVLEYRDNQIKLSMYYRNILILAKRILEILRTGKIPKSSISYNCFDNISWNIQHGKFKRALRLKTKIVKESNISDAEYILLTKINEVISSIKEEELNNSCSEKTGNIDVDNIMAKLYQQNIKEAVELTKQYLKQLGKEEYENLIINLIKISSHERNNNSYLKVSSVLLELSKDEYEYNITVYLQYFYDSINAYQLIIARLYLNIIANYSKEFPNIINSLETDLINAQNRYNEQINNTREFVLEKLSEMKAKGDTIIILDPMPHTARKIFYTEIKKIPELRAFGIGSEPKQLVLRYLNPELGKNLYESHNSLTEKYIKAYKQKNYEECIRIIRYILENPTYGGFYPQIYEYLGLSYSHLQNPQEAKKYLTISQELSKEIKSRKNKYPQKNETNTPQQYGEQKPYVSVKENEFDAPNDNFGITNIEDIAYYIQMEKIPLEVACQNLSLTEEQVQLVKLIYARDYYTESMYQQGDKLLQEVEKSKNKTAKVRDLLNEIRSRKLFYKNRPNAHTRKRIMQTVNN